MEMSDEKLSPCDSFRARLRHGRCRHWKRANAFLDAECADTFCYHPDAVLGPNCPGPFSEHATRALGHDVAKFSGPTRSREPVRKSDRAGSATLKERRPL